MCGALILKYTIPLNLDDIYHSHLPNDNDTSNFITTQSSNSSTYSQTTNDENNSSIVSEQIYYRRKRTSALQYGCDVKRNEEDMQQEPLASLL